jgi:hypothetical protein
VKRTLYFTAGTVQHTFARPMTEEESALECSGVIIHTAAF